MYQQKPDIEVEHDFELIVMKKMRVSGRPASPGIDDEMMVLMQIEEITDVVK